MLRTRPGKYLPSVPARYQDLKLALDTVECDVKGCIAVSSCWLSWGCVAAHHSTLHCCPDSQTLVVCCITFTP